MMVRLIIGEAVRHLEQGKQIFVSLNLFQILVTLKASKNKRSGVRKEKKISSSTFNKGILNVIWSHIQQRQTSLLWHGMLLKILFWGRLAWFHKINLKRQWCHFKFFQPFCDLKTHYKANHMERRFRVLKL